MAKSALTTLLLNASYMLEIGTPSTSTKPTKAELTAWLNEGQRYIADKVPWIVLKDLITLYNPSLAAVSVAAWSGLVTTTYDFFKPCYATLNVSGTGSDLPLKLVTPQTAAQVVNNDLIYDAANPIMWFDATNINFLPATTGGAATGKLKFYYIKEPTLMSDDANTTALGKEFEDALVYYAVAKARAQEEEWQQYSILMQQCNESLLAIIQSYQHLFNVRKM